MRPNYSFMLCIRISTKNSEMSVLAGSGGVGGSEKGDIFEKYGEEASPFDLVTEEAVEEDIMANGETGGSGGLSDDDDNSDEDIPEELKRDYVDEQTGDAPPPTSHHASQRLQHSKVSAQIDCCLSSVTGFSRILCSLMGI